MTTRAEQRCNPQRHVVVGVDAGHRAQLRCIRRDARVN
jgi:hypothetical protein